jgi:Family of unknown function (DUF5677)
MTSNNLVEEKLVAFLQKASNQALNNAHELRFDNQHPQQLYAMCLYGTILETIISCLTLAKEQQLMTLPILLRSLSEAYVDLVNLINDESYYDRMHATFLKEKIRLLKNSLGDQSNPFLMYVSDAPAEELKESEAYLEQLIQEGKKPIKALDKFKLAELENVYQSVYGVLCNHSHNNISALSSRHIEKRGEDYEVAFFKDRGLSNPLPYFDSLNATLIQSSMLIHKLLESSVQKDIQKLWEEFEVLRQQYSS